MSSHEIHHLLHVYGLATVFVVVAAQAFWIPLPGSTALIAASVYAASQHGFPIVAVILVGAGGAVVGGLAGYALGAWRGEWALRRVAKLLRQRPDRVDWLQAKLDQHAVIALFVARWVTGARNGAGIACGASGMRLTKFAAITTASALLWATVTGLEFYFFGSVILSAPTWLQALVVIGGLVIAAVIFNRIRRASLRGQSVA